MKQFFSWILLSVIVLCSALSTVGEYKVLYQVDEKVEMEENNENPNIKESKKIEWLFSFHNLIPIKKIFSGNTKNKIHHSEDDFFDSHNFSILPDMPPEFLI
jgi:hypothetical protein